MRINQMWLSLKANAKLGWNQDGNWTHPALYLLFSLITPMSGVLMLVFMYQVVRGGDTDQSFLMFLLAGSSVFFFVRALLTGAGFAVVEDREHYRVFRYIYIAPAPFAIQIAGRVMVKLLIAVISVIVTIPVFTMIMKVSIRTGGIDWITFLGSLIMGILGMSAIALMLTSVMLLIDRMGWVWAEGMAGLMLLASGAVIPTTLLPAPLAMLGRILPTTYWADLWRIALYGDASLRTLPSLTISALWLGLLLTSVIWMFISVFWYKIADHLARSWGRIERETFY